MMTREGHHEKVGLRSPFGRNISLSIAPSRRVHFDEATIASTGGRSMIHKAGVFPFLVRSPMRSRLAIAAGVSGLLVLVALVPFREDQSDAAPAASPIPRVVATEAAGAGGARSYSYYPEQLAALRSMSNFTPIADEGLKPEREAIPTVAAAKNAPQSPRIVRRADAPVKVAALVQAAPAPAAAQFDPQPAAHEQTQPKSKFFGMSLPGLPDLGQGVKGAREAATRWGKAAAGLGDRIAGLWR
jgi:hypothetical protein